MSHEAKWYEWFIQTQECLDTHVRPGECVGASGELVLPIMLGIYLAVAIAFWSMGAQEGQGN